MLTDENGDLSDDELEEWLLSNKSDNPMEDACLNFDDRFPEIDGDWPGVLQGGCE